MMRAAGEALAVQMVIGNRPDRPHQPDAADDDPDVADHARTWATPSPGEPANEALWTMGLVLLFISFGFVLLVRRMGPEGGPDMRRTLVADRMATLGLWAIAVFVIANPARDHQLLPHPGGRDPEPVDSCSATPAKRTRSAASGRSCFNSVYMLGC
jgi:hypothetical protein